ncbi:FMN-binding protein [Amycolatopsis sp. NPDC051106]|uniref:FMN-binding protein n=1 Tax=unclassified Amycolatopsis TaxID=2618356 RepID=UPI00342791D7
MRKIAIIGAATVSVVVLLFSYHTSRGPDPLAGALPAVRPAPGGGTPPPFPNSAAPPGPGSGEGTFTGTAADTRYGPVQVRITVSGSRIIAADAVQVPQESSRDVRINSAAVPILDDETVWAQSAQIDTVSGATYTSEGYAQSLQSAIDAAHR